MEEEDIQKDTKKDEVAGKNNEYTRFVTYLADIFNTSLHAVSKYICSGDHEPTSEIRFLKC